MELVPPSALLEVKLQVPGVGSNPFPLIVPIPDTSRNCALWDITVEELRSNVNPPTLHRADVAGPGAGDPGVPELKIQGAAMAAEVPATDTGKIARALQDQRTVPLDYLRGGSQ